jgi:hypothetical protein
MRREHVFYRCWKARVAEKGALTRGELEQVLAYQRRIHPVGDIIGDLCEAGSLSEADASWLLAELPGESYAWRQVDALRALRGILADPELDWGSRLERALALRRDWPAARVVRRMPVEELADARDIIGRAARGKRTRNWLLILVDTRLRRAGLLPVVPRGRACGRMDRSGGAGG